MRSLPIHKHARSLLLAAIAALTLQGCTTEPDEIVRPEADQLQVRFEVTLPADMRQGPQTRMSAEQEATVSTIDVYHFVKNTGDADTYANYKGVSHDPAQGTFTEGPPSWINARLSTQPGKDSRLVFVVNARKSGNYGYTAGMTLKDLTEALIFDHSGDWNSVSATPTPLPMYGITGIVEIKKDMNPELTGANDKPFGLMRMHAKFNIRLREPLTEGVFKLVSVCVFNQKEKGYIAYDPAKLNITDPDKPFVTSFNIPTNPGNVYEPAEPYFTAGTDPLDTENYGRIINKQYVFEADNASQTDKLKKTALVVGGYYNGVAEIPANLSYYRVDVPDNVTGGNILRNRLYDVEIQHVKGSGSGTAKEAFEGGASIQAKIDVWNLADQNLVQNGQYRLWVEKSKENLGEEINTTATIKTTTTHPNGITLDKTGMATWLSVTAVKETDDEWTITLKALQANPYGTIRVTNFYITAGNMRYKFTARQLSEPQFIISPTNYLSFPSTGGPRDFTISSHYKMPDGIEPIEWITEFSEDNGVTWTDTPPLWVTSFPMTGPGGDVTTYTAAVAPFLPTTTNAEDNTIKDATPKGTETAPYDLSKMGGSVMNTANCYVVNASGYYKLPLVYGNAIKNGATNASSYTSAAQTGNTNVLYEFPRHDDNPITSPYIKSNGFTPADAVVVWMDSPNLITEVKLIENGDYLSFYIPNDYVGQGNGIVAARNASGTILWSWHIWVTAPNIFDVENPATDPTVNRTSVTNEFMQYNLGWCTTKRVNYGTAMGTVKLRFTQVGITNPKTIQHEIRQQNSSYTTGENNPYWQWGRKDPMVPGDLYNMSSVKNKVTYGEYTFVRETGPVSIGTAISNPHLFYTGSNNWCSTTHYNYWDADNSVTTVNDNAVVKTVYDPSPVGFRMPSSGAWTGFTTTGGEAMSGSYATVNGNWSGTNSSFYISGSSSGPRVYYLKMGFRMGNSSPLTNVTGQGAYWSSGVYGPTNGLSLNYSYSSQYSFTMHPASPVGTKNMGYSVRCVKE